MSGNKVYLVATKGRWHVKAFNETIKNYEGDWHLITSPAELTVDAISKINPRYIFFPHWSDIVPPEILELSECVCFHETDLPFGRGGSPIQNLIVRGHRETMVSAIRMEEGLDTGPVFMKRGLSLEGLAEEVYLRISGLVAEMIKVIIEEEPEPEPQVGEATNFSRRKPAESKIPGDIETIEDLFDFIRMLDAEGYPMAFLEFNGFKAEISRPALKTDHILADIRISKKSDGEKKKTD